MPTASSGAPIPPLDLFARYLSRLGWTRAHEAPRVEMGGGARAAGRAPRQPAAARWQAFFLGGKPGPTLCVASPETTPLTPPSRLYAQFEDMDGQTRHLLSLWRATPGAAPDYALLTDVRVTLLLDCATEEILASCEDPGEISERILPRLNRRDFERGALASLPRRPDEDYGRELAAWRFHWMNLLGAAMGAHVAGMAGFLDALLLARLAERLGLAVASERLEDWGWKHAPAGAGGRSAAASRKTASSRAISVLRRIWTELGKFGYLPGGAAGGARTLLGAAERLAPGGSLDRCLASLSRLSVRRLRSDVFARASADEELRRIEWKAAVQGLAEPVAPWSHAAAPDSFLNTPWEVDLGATGPGAALRALDLAVEALRDFNRRQRAQTLRGGRPSLQADLFAPPPDELGGALYVEDPVAWAFSRIVRVKTRGAEDAALLRLAFAARALEIRARELSPLLPLPDLGVVVPDPPREAAGG